MSTKPNGRATSRTVSSVMSVGTFADFLGQDTQMAASCGSFLRSMGSNRASALRSVANACTRFVEEFAVSRRHCAPLFGPRQIIARLSPASRSATRCGISYATPKNKLGNIHVAKLTGTFANHGCLHRPGGG